MPPKFLVGEIAINQRNNFIEVFFDVQTFRFCCGARAALQKQRHDRIFQQVAAFLCIHRPNLGDRGKNNMEKKFSVTFPPRLSSNEVNNENSSRNNVTYRV